MTSQKSPLTHTLVVQPDGTLQFVYCDELAVLFPEASIKRASHVEPGDDGQWYADMSPVLGPVLGPFGMRGDALVAENEWLHDHTEKWMLLA